MKRLVNGRWFGPVFTILLVIGAVIGSRLAASGVTPDQLAQASIEGCEGQNMVRVALETRIMGDIAEKLVELRDQIGVDPSLFPDIPLHRFAALLSDNVRVTGSLIEFNANQLPLTKLADCEERYLGDSA